MDTFQDSMRASPKEDVCKTCEDCKQDIQLATAENDKISATQKYHQHVLQARKERELYVECVSRSTAMFVNREQRDQAAGDGFSTNDVHYTFDFSQYIKLPHHAQEKGPTFFIQPRKVQIFGFRVDGFKQYNHLIDEDQTIEQPRRHVEHRQSVRQFIEEIPKLESHYCRTSSSKMYLKPLFDTFSSLYKDNMAYCKEKNIKEADRSI